MPPSAAAPEEGVAGVPPNNAGSTSKGSIRTGVALLWAKTGVLTINTAPPKPSVATQTASGKRTPIGAGAP